MTRKFTAAMDPYGNRKHIEIVKPRDILFIELNNPYNQKRKNAVSNAISIDTAFYLLFCAIVYAQKA